MFMYVAIAFLIACVLVFLVTAAISLLYTGAQNNKWTTNVDEGTMKFKVKGKSLDSVLLNVDDHHYEPSTHKIVKDGYHYDAVTHTEVPDEKPKEEPKPEVEKNLSPTDLPLNEAKPGDEPPKPVLIDQLGWFEKFVRNSVEKFLDTLGILAEIKRAAKGPWWQREFGVWWVSIFYPLKHIYLFTINKSRMKSQDKVNEDTPLSLKLEHEPKTVVDNLRWQFQIPFFIEEVDFKDGTRVNFIVMGLFQVVDPYIAVFVHGGEKYFNLLESAVGVVVTDYCRNKDYRDFIATNGEDFRKAFCSICEGPSGTEQLVGIRAINGQIEDWALSSKDQKMQDAVERKEIAKREAEATVETAMGQQRAAIIVAEGDKQAAILRFQAEAEGINLRANATANRFGKSVKAFTDNGVTASAAARVIGEQVRTENIAGPDSKIHTYVEGGAGVPTSLLLKGEEDRQARQQPQAAAVATPQAAPAKETRQEPKPTTQARPQGEPNRGFQNTPRMGKPRGRRR